MAQIVMITKDTERLGIAVIGDKVSVHEDDVELTGPGYENFEIIQIGGMTVVEVIAKLKAIDPVISAESEDVDRKVYWDDGGTLREIKKRPKYQCNLSGLTPTDKTDLSQNVKSKVEKESILDKIISNIKTDPFNQTEKA